MLYLQKHKNGGTIIEKDKIYKIWISLIKNLGIKRYTKLIQKFGSRENLWKAKKEQLEKVEGIGEELATIISNISIKKDLIRHLNYMEKTNIDIISIEDKEYPSLLKNIYSPPLNLYIRGNKEVLNMPSIAIVGCRNASSYGINIAQDFAYNLSKNGFNIVSGLAKGIDSYAHLGAVKAKEKTTAVLGNGLDTIYPKENLELAENILSSGGAIISEYPLGTRPEKMNFPARNRIISGMCNGVLVVEAKEKSGTLITLDFALEQGRDVFAIPGNINSENSFGTNDIIKQGAKLVTSWEEIVEEYKVCDELLYNKKVYNGESI